MQQLLYYFCSNYGHFDVNFPSPSLASSVKWSDGWIRLDTVTLRCVVSSHTSVEPGAIKPSKVSRHNARSRSNLWF